MRMAGGFVRLSEKMDTSFHGILVARAAIAAAGGRRSRRGHGDCMECWAGLQTFSLLSGGRGRYCSQITRGLCGRSETRVGVSGKPVIARGVFGRRRELLETATG